ncbi:MAG: M14 family metallopeptidase [Bacteroidota bacterium]
MIRAVALSVVVVLVSSAQINVRVPLNYYLPDTATYDPAIPTPEQFFGFQVGEWHLSPDQIHAYVRRLDDLSERIRIEPMGVSHEQRPILLLVITAPEHQRDLERIRQEHLRLSAPTGGSTPAIDRMPVVVWMGYSVHGNEASGSNAAALVAYHFAASRSPETEDQLRNAVILLNPSINPDGLHRFASWVNAHRGAVVTPQASSREHNEPWPGSRGNHYWYDLNRDWMPLQHPESRARVERYYAWRPNVLTDHHEMGTTATFFFQPGIPSRNNPLTPSSVGDLTSRMAVYHAEALDRIGSLYYTRESFDDFYVGKGSSYPDITGGIGILFEQASARGHAQESPGGTITFPFAIRNHVTASLSSVRGSVALRTDLLRHQREMASSALTAAAASPVKAYVVGTDDDPVRSAAFVDILVRHQIEVFRTGKSVRHGDKEIEAGQGFVIPVRQPQFRLVTSLFERRTRFEDSLFYDVSAWNLPSAFNLPSVELTTIPSGLVGPRVASPAVSGTLFTPREGAIAYAFAWHNFRSSVTLYRLLAAGIHARVSVKPFESRTAEGVRSFAPGSIVVPVISQVDRSAILQSILQEAAAQDGIIVEQLTTGLSGSGIDLGSSNLIPVPLPRIALLAGAGASGTDAGEVWHLLDERLRIPVTLLEPDALGRVDLHAFNVLIMAGGSFATIDSAGRAAAQEWTGRGNTLIATEQAAEWAIANRLATAAVKRPLPSRKDSALILPYADEESYRSARAMPGAIVQAQLDLTHPLTFGYRSATISLFKSTPLVFDVPKSPFALPVQFGTDPLVSGYIHEDVLKNISGGGSVVVSAVRSGRSILLSDNPAFRGFWYGTNHLLLNAVFFGPVIRASSARPGG